VLVADTSALFALFAIDDPHHARARVELSRQRAFAVPSEILTETLAILQRRFGREASQAAFETLVAIPHARIAATRQAVVDRAVASSRQGGPLTYQDWIVVHSCALAGAQPWTYDNDLRRACR